MSRPSFDTPPPPKPGQPRAAEPRFGRNFDPWNSVALGHQRAETKGPQGWRDNRNWKLHGQFRSGHSGGSRMSDAVGAGSEDFDEKNKVLVPKEVQARAATNVMDMLRNPGVMKTQSGSTTTTTTTTAAVATADKKGNTAVAPGDVPALDVDEVTRQRRLQDRHRAETKAAEQPRKMFEGLVIYVNGSTHPLVSDHRLKHLLAEHGARMSIHLGRRQVTHVILGRPVAGGGGAGGGLAGGKLEREIRRVGGCGVKFVGVEWVLESIKAGRRLPEARFSNLKVASGRQQSVYGHLQRSHEKMKRV